MEKVSIIIPCYNQAHFLHEAIESSIIQTYAKVQIIVVDDGSTDNTRQVAERYPIKYIYQNNNHLSSARNTGINASRGDWILPLDADDKIVPEFIEKTLKCAKENKSDIVSTWLQTFGNENRRWGSLNVEPVYQNFIQQNQINCCSLFKKSMWVDLGGYDENMKQGFEDWDFWRRATRKGYKVNILTEYLFQYRKHGVSMFAAAQLRRKEIIDFMRKKESETGKLIDIVYPLGTNSRNSNNELKFSLRSVEKHLTGWNKVWIIGEFPRWGNHELKHIATTFKYEKALNILEKLKTACECDEISDDFLYMNDDHIFLENCDACTYPNYYSNEAKDEILKNRPFVDPYVEMINETYSYEPKMKYYDIHKPIIINKKRFLEMYEDIDFHKHRHGLLIKSMYGIYAAKTWQKTTDCILRNLEDGKNIAEKVKGNDLFSFHDEAICKEFIQFLDKNYPIKSQFEQ